MSTAGRRRGSDTKAEILDVALELFTEHGYETTSLREIAERLGITKAALYYHFSSKEDIVRTLVEEHLTAFDELLAWVKAQPRTPELAHQTLIRWADMITNHGMRMVRFATANPHAMREVAPVKEGFLGRLRDLFAALVGPEAPVQEHLRVRMALLSVNVAVMTAQDLEVDDSVVIAAALDMAHKVLGEAPAPTEPAAEAATKPATKPPIEATPEPAGQGRRATPQ